MSDKIGGVAEINGKSYAFPVSAGIGLILDGGRALLVRFSCPMETMPPKGRGAVISTSFRLTVLDGVPGYCGDTVHLGRAV